MVSQGRTFSIYSRAFLRFCLCVIDSIDLWQRKYIDIQAAGLVVKLFDHAGQLIARMILLPQVGDGGVTHIALREIDVIAVTLDQTPARADGQYMARHAAARLVERLRGEEIASGRQRQTARADGETVPAAKYGL